MNAFLALVAREISERKALLAAAAVASLFPLVAPLLPTTGSNPAEDIREVVMWFMTWGLIPLFALLLGVTFIGRDLAEGRLGFFFAQPLSGPTIWFGKLMAVVLLIWGAQLILMLPTALFSSEPLRILVAKGLFFEPLSPWISSVALWIAPMAVLLVAHALGLVWRARSLWILVDVIALTLIVIAGRWIVGPFLRVFAGKVTFAIYGWLLVATLIGLFLAGAFQLANGRVDARRGHRSLSVVLWSSLVVATVVAAGWGWWIRSASPDDLNQLHQISVGSGDWFAVTGPSNGRLDFFPGFIINTTDGRWVSAHSGSVVQKRGVEFSEDMSCAVWTTPYSYKETKLMAVDLSGDDPSPKWTGVIFDRHWSDLVVSPAGHRVAVIHGGAVSVFDIDSGELLAAAQPRSDYSPYRLQFTDETRIDVLTGLRVRSSDDSNSYEMRWKEQRFDLTTRKLDDGREIRSTWRWWGGPLENPLRRTLERHMIEGRHHLVLVRLEDREVVADLGEMPNRWSSVRVMADGRIVVKREGEDRLYLQVFDSEGSELEKVEIDQAGWAQISGEVSPARLAVGQIIWGAEDGQPSQRSTEIIDIQTGSTTHIIKDVSPILGRWGVKSSSGAWEVGSIATRLMEGKDGSLHLWDPETNELKQLIPVPD